MTPFRQPEATEAYTRASVEAYLRAASDEKARLHAAIGEAGSGRPRPKWTSST